MKKTTRIVIKAATRFAVKTAKGAAVRYAARTAKEYAAGTADKIREKGLAERKAHVLHEDIVLRTVTESDRDAVIDLMRAFYSSDATFTEASDEIFNNDITACVTDNPFLEGFVFETDTAVLGYAMIAHSFSVEFGRPCLWIEDLYLREEARGLGLASRFFEFITAEYPDALLRLEAEQGNVHAMEVYRRKGFKEIPYAEMYRDNTDEQ